MIRSTARNLRSVSSTVSPNPPRAVVGRVQTFQNSARFWKAETYHGLALQSSHRCENLFVHRGLPVNKPKEDAGIEQLSH